MAIIDHPSLHWLGPKEHNFEFNLSGKAALRKFNALDHRGICAFISTLRNGIPCRISPQFKFGSTHLFIELAFTDNVFCVARLNTWQVDGGDKKIESEVRVMNLVRACTRIPVPKVYAWNYTSKNVFGTPFIITQAMNGQKLSLNEPVYEKFKAKILDQMASIMIQLSTIQFQTIGDIETLNNFVESTLLEKKVCFKSSRDYYDYYIDKHLQGFESVSNHEKVQYISENRLCRRLVRQLERPNRPFPLTILPFGQSSKVLIDEMDNITGLMGWSHVGAYPWEMFAEFPQVIRISWLYCSNYSAQKWQVKSDGQRYFVECLRKYERQLKLPGFVSSLIGSDAKIVSEGVLSIDRGFLRTRWMRILKGIETRKRDPGY